MWSGWSHRCGIGDCDGIFLASSEQASRLSAEIFRYGESPDHPSVGFQSRTVGIPLTTTCYARSNHTPTNLYAATVAVAISDHGPFSPRVLTQRSV